MNPTNPQILLVDDDSVMRTLLAQLIKREGFTHFQCVASGAEAVAKFPVLRPDVVFLDIMMPGMNGLDTLRALREFGTSMHAVMISGTPRAQYVIEARDLGAAAFLVKPLSQKKVGDAIRYCIEHAHAGSAELFIG
jgi:two-component system chemotaxis response regulator CheY